MAHYTTLDQDLLEYCRIKRELSRVTFASPLSTDAYRPVEIPDFCPPEMRAEALAEPPPPVPCETQLGCLQNALRYLHYQERVLRSA